ncbi:MAG: hypothetical protein QI199_08060, partial [Candidatus Korarchaeota archaeon]|nr:hypothetical protein [Candidatus Korarchaeota archaeon]
GGGRGRGVGGGFDLALASRPGDNAVILASVLAGKSALHEDVGEGPRPAGAALPDTIGGIIGCPNPTCITNQPREKVHRRYRVLRRRGGILLQCVYCGTLIGGEELRRILASRLR